MSDKMLAASHWRTVQRQHLRGVGENAEPILPRHRDEAARRTIAELRSCSITNVRKSDGNQVAVGNIPNGAVPEKSERACFRKRSNVGSAFRPHRRPKRLRDKREKYHHSLKALAVRENKIHIVGRPELKNESTPVYLDVEGLPDQ